MLKRGEVHIWRVWLERAQALPPTVAETERAARFASADLSRRYLRSHAALRSILGEFTSVQLDFAVHEHGKPYLEAAPEIRFNLSHSGEMALVAVTRESEVGVDIERIRPLPEYAAIAERYLPPGAAAPEGVRDFFRQWTRYEAALKAHGAGLFGAGAAPPGEWSVVELEAGADYAAALAVEGGPPAVYMHEL